MADTYAKLFRTPTGRIELACSNCHVSVSLPVKQDTYSDPEAQVLGYRIDQMMTHIDGHNSNAH